MKLKLNKKKMKSLSSDKVTVPANMTPKIAGGQQEAFWSIDLDDRAWSRCRCWLK
jgi:hypothetical protein